MGLLYSSVRTLAALRSIMYARQIIETTVMSFSLARRLSSAKEARLHQIHLADGVQGRRH
jgi:hypothetical protein